MSTLKCFEKTIKRIENWQESCVGLQHDLRVLLGENVSIADIAVTKDGYEKKKKNISETTITADNKGTIKQITGNRESRLSPQKEKEIKIALDKGQTIVAGDEEPSETPEEQDTQNQHKITVARIKRTEDLVPKDPKIMSYLGRYYDARRNGNFEQAKHIQSKINEFIANRDLDHETVYASYYKQEPDEDEDETVDMDEPEDVTSVEPEEDKEDKENSDKDSEE